MSELVCYCFGFSKEDILRDVKENQGRSEILGFIVDKKRKGQCECHIRNPKGT
ncbi:BFD-like (2Fe-2S) protein [Thermodesulfobacterium sp. TA1]|uniref:BFD-like (2Fe-2S) protein n=1 Tax=Thermodesulfobacterium sp. TA1 TaxID=2234087 RepID=UPI0012326E2D|nr:BFD-like (2Fe-2S) protein [Thermodesulfobacterium sp. TA1]QER41992.1 BFD-like (2Fe-2S) protein [Thermodesulfobacterium sp. TA1]